jgi:hypothetical protein
MLPRFFEHKTPCTFHIPGDEANSDERMQSGGLHPGCTRSVAAFLVARNYSHAKGELYVARRIWQPCTRGA